MSSPRFRVDPHHGLGWLLVLAAAYFALHGVHAANKPQGSDFTIYYEAGRALLEGRDPGSVAGFLYLPFFALCMLPLVLLPYAAAVVLWQLGNLAALLWSARVCVDLVRSTGLDAPRWLAWAPLLCVLRLADSNFSNGQVNLFLLALVLAALRAWLAGRELRAGAWLGLAAALKLVPAFLAIAFALRGSWRAAAAALLLAVGCVFLVPAAYPGWSQNLHQLSGWWQRETRPYLVGGEELVERREYVPGQSLTPVVYRLLTATPASAPDTEPQRENLLALEPASAHRILVALQVVVLVVLLLTLWRSSRSAAPVARLYEWSAAMCAALLLAPLVHKAHLIWLLLPYTLLLAGAPMDLGSWARRLRWLLLGLSVVLIGLTAPALLGPLVRDWPLAHNAIFFGHLCLAGALLVDIWGRAAVPGRLSP